MARLTSFSKFLLTFLVVAVVGGGLYYLANKTQMGKELGQSTDPNKPANDGPTTPRDGNTINIGVVTWGGYAGGQYYNEGFKANENSRFFKECGFKVEFKVLDDFVALARGVESR